MAYYVVYKSEVRKRTTEQGKEEHYVNVGVFYSYKFMQESGALEWTQHETEDDASGAWDAYCGKMRSKWPRKAGMDIAEEEKYRQVLEGTVTIDGSHLKVEVDRNEPPKRLF